MKIVRKKRCFFIFGLMTIAMINGCAKEIKLPTENRQERFISQDNPSSAGKCRICSKFNDPQMKNGGYETCGDWVDCKEAQALSELFPTSEYETRTIEPSI